MACRSKPSRWAWHGPREVRWPMSGSSRRLGGFVPDRPSGLCGLRVLVASHVSGSDKIEALERYGENVVVTETRVRVPLGDYPKLSTDHGSGVFATGRLRTSRGRQTGCRSGAQASQESQLNQEADHALSFLGVQPRLNGRQDRRPKGSSFCEPRLGRWPPQEPMPQLAAFETEARSGRQRCCASSKGHTGRRPDRRARHSEGRHGRDFRGRHRRGHRPGGSGGDLRGVPTSGDGGQEGRGDGARTGPVPEVH